MKVLGLPSARLLATYCCSKFVVHRYQILKRGLAFFQKAADLLKNNFEDIAGCKYESNRSSASSMRSEWNIFADLRQERLAGESENENVPETTAFQMRLCYLYEAELHHAAPLCGFRNPKMSFDLMP
jgi:hypothetical protein